MKPLIQWLWEQPQTLIGWILANILKSERIAGYRKRRVARTKLHIGVSLGGYIILHELSAYFSLKHEYGHCRQSSYLGPLYLIVVGLPSIARAAWILVMCYCFKKHPLEAAAWYYSHYPEKWADRLGGVER